MRRRIKLSRGKSRKVFTKYAKRIHKKNHRRIPMRGGIRI